MRDIYLIYYITFHGLSITRNLSLTAKVGSLLIRYDYDINQFIIEYSVKLIYDGCSTLKLRNLHSGLKVKKLRRSRMSMQGNERLFFLIIQKKEAEGEMEGWKD